MALTESPARTLSIAEAAKASGLSTHTLRYAERAGLHEPVGQLDLYDERLGRA